MKAHRVQRSSFGMIREELYIPEIETAFGSLTHGVHDTSFSFYSAGHDEMSHEMLEDLEGVVSGEIPHRKDYTVHDKGAVEINDDYIASLKTSIKNLDGRKISISKKESSRIFKLITCEN